MERECSLKRVYHGKKREKEGKRGNDDEKLLSLKYTSLFITGPCDMTEHLK